MGEDENGIGHVDTFDDSDEISEDDLVTIQDEEGNEYHCVLMAIIEHDAKEYAALVPYDQLMDDEAETQDLFIFEYVISKDDVEQFIGVEDDDVWEAVQDFYATKLAEHSQELGG